MYWAVTTAILSLLPTSVFRYACFESFLNLAAGSACGGLHPLQSPWPEPSPSPILMVVSLFLCLYGPVCVTNGILSIHMQV